MTDRTAGSPLSKAEKRAAAKAAKARARRAAKRRRILAVTGAVVAVVAVIAAVVVLIVRSGGSTSPSAAASGTPAAAPAATTAAAFPPLPAGADPALASRPEVKAGTGALKDLVKTTLIEGTGPATQQGQTITVNYVGVTYNDGKEFDASWNSKQPFSFTVGGGSVIPGWDQGLVGIKVGTRLQLDIPSFLAYGDNPGDGRPAGALRFVVDVLAAS